MVFRSRLGIKRDDSRYVEIKKAYHELLLKSHPDKGGSAEDFLSVQEAFSAFKHWYLEHWDSRLTIQTALAVDFVDVYNGVTKKLVVTVYDHRTGSFGKQIVYLDLCDFESFHTVPCMGDVGIDGRKGDLDVTVNTIKQNKFKIISKDIFVDKQIDLIQFIYGDLLRLDLPDGTFVPVTVSPLTFEKQVCLEGFGLPYYDDYGARCRGDLYVNLELDRSTVDPSYFGDQEFRGCLEAKFKYKPQTT